LVVGIGEEKNGKLKLSATFKPSGQGPDGHSEKKKCSGGL